MRLHFVSKGAQNKSNLTICRDRYKLEGRDWKSLLCFGWTGPLNRGNTSHWRMSPLKQQNAPLTLDGQCVCVSVVCVDVVVKVDQSWLNLCWEKLQWLYWGNASSPWAPAPGARCPDADNGKHGRPKYSQHRNYLRAKRHLLCCCCSSAEYLVICQVTANTRHKKQQSANESLSTNPQREPNQQLLRTP